tara:strand:+ start:737 stop:1060 length:324 start_codon:yes stop_codon:yes gene_type:complete
MPWNADVRCGMVSIELNVASIIYEMEMWLEKEYTEDIKEGSKFWLYVIQLENSYMEDLFFKGNLNDIQAWLIENYDKVEMWNEIQDFFVEEEEEEEEDTDDKKEVGV